MSKRRLMAGEPCRILELRRYALKPGARDTLIELFDRELVEPQEELGMRILGQFRDLDDPDSFVWMRGFTDMEARKRALETFYSGPVWKKHAAAANATMVDVDNVLLLRPVSGLELDTSCRPAPGSASTRPGLLAVTIYPLAGPADDFAGFFQRELEPALRAADTSVLATYATEHSENTFPALPIRVNENVFVWLAGFADDAAHASRVATIEGSPTWRDGLARALAQRLDGRVEVLRLSPTARSLLPA